jgi:anthranilate synthase/phosphoribosyltransferase
MILLLDNYDSFTYNLYQVFLKMGCELKVVRSDKITITEIRELHPTHIILSPGPGTPDDAGVCLDVVKELHGEFPILGVCLGHQSILQAFGTPIVRADRIVHGKVENIHHNGRGLFRNLSNPTRCTRYHSLVGKEPQVPDCFEITARSEDGEVMGVEHREHCLVGLQIHPESIGTSEGEMMIRNFLKYRRDNIPVKAILASLLDGKNLSRDEAADFMDEMTEGNLHDAQLGSFLTSLQIKGVTADELAGFSSILRSKASYFPTPAEGEKRLDTCGTGGSRSAKTFNVSTIASLVLAAGGAKVVKHGNRAVTSKSGSADLLEKLGINIEMTPETSAEVYSKIGITFLYARKFHSAMRFAGPTRASLGFRTAFNLIGPLSNPAQATHQVIGVFCEEYTEVFCRALSQLGVERAMVIHGLDGLDEISLCAPTKISELKDGWIKSWIFNPEEIGISLVDHEQLTGGDATANFDIAMDILAGNPSPRANLVLLNAGAAFYCYGMADSIEDGYRKAISVVDSGKALDLVKEFAKLSNI